MEWAGSIFEKLYIEIDPNFPWANVEALFAVARELRQGRVTGWAAP